MDTPITRAEHEEFCRRMEAENQRLEDENNRQNRRLELLEKDVRENKALTISVEKMAVNMENMLQEQKKQGKRLEKLEAEPAETQKQIKNSVITALSGGVVGAVITALLSLL